MSTQVTITLPDMRVNVKRNVVIGVLAGVAALVIAIVGVSVATAGSGGSTQSYLNRMHRMPGWGHTLNSVIVADGHAVCHALDKGYKPQTVWSVMMSAEHISAKRSGELLGAAAANLCPSNLPEVKNWAESS